MWTVRSVATVACLLFAMAPCYATDLVEAQTQAFLTAYVAGDSASVLSVVGPETVVYGSDAAEIFRGPGEILGMLKNDRALWGDSAHIGPLQHVSIVRRGDLASIFFDAPFSAGGRPAVLVRFALVWRVNRGHWLLEQSSNTVPTTGQSAAELLGHAAR